MLVICVHTWNPKAPGMTEKEFLAMREKFLKGLMAKKLPVKSVQAALNFEQGKGWCLWETDTAARMEGIMAENPGVHTEVIPVKLAPQIM
jgi:hypothetical protein